MTTRPPTYHLGPDFDAQLTALAQSFTEEAMAKIGDSFANVDEFVKCALADTRDRDDHELRRTPKKFYLLEAVAYKLYDLANREAFNKTDSTLIILPDCLSLHNPDCCKEEGPFGDRCRECTPDCQAALVMELGAKYGAEVVFSKRKLEQQIEHFASEKDNLGVIGVGCLLMLANGMRTAMSLGVPTRGVPLSYTGCEHWNDEPFASSFPMKQLEAILEEKAAFRRV